MHSNYKEQVCKICMYGDGKWKERMGEKMNDALPVCEKCKADGWTDDPKEIVDGLNNDPLFKLGIESPYE